MYIKIYIYTEIAGVISSTAMMYMMVLDERSTRYTIYIRANTQTISYYAKPNLADSRFPLIKPDDCTGGRGKSAENERTKVVYSNLLYAYTRAVYTKSSSSTQAVR